MRLTDRRTLTEKLLEVPQELIRTALDLELQGGTVIADRVGETDCIFLVGLHGAERAVAERLLTLAKGTLPWPWIDAEKALPWIEQRTGLALAESQTAAVRLALTAKVLVITGGPGVGKTTIVNSILRILVENYLGFPTGITGMALMARAYNQAQKFGAEMAIPAEVVGLQAPSDPDPDHFILTLSNDERVSARAVVIASGARYRRLAVVDLEKYEAASVHYWASPLEAKLCAGQELALVGGGNSAGQAAVYLASQALKVWLLVRGTDLQASMSRYLVDRIAGLSNVEVVTQARVSGLEGNAGVLEAILWRQGTPEKEVRRLIHHLFLFIGAEPNTNWLSGSGVALDTKGFVLTGGDASNGPSLETGRRGVFAIGDVRSSSVKRVAAAVGEGAQVVAALHAFLAATDRERVARAYH